MGATDARPGPHDPLWAVVLVLPLLACLGLRDWLGPASSVWPLAALLAGTLALRPRLGDLRSQAIRPAGLGWWALGGVALAGLGGLWPAQAPPGWTACWLVVCVPVAEELYFRGLVWEATAHAGVSSLAWLLATALFVVAHVGAMPVWEAAAMGLAFGAARHWGGSVWCAAALHAGWNGGVVVGPAVGAVALVAVVVGRRGVSHGPDDGLEGAHGR
jgi:membrane protease YdiL (CAAX protease family)